MCLLTAKSFQSRHTLCDPMDCSPPSSSVHGVLQTRILEWTACPLPGDLPNPGIKPESLPSPALAGGFFTTSATWEATADSHCCREETHTTMPSNYLPIKDTEKKKKKPDYILRRVLSVLTEREHLILTMTQAGGGVFWVIPIFQMRKLRFSEVRSDVYGHMAETLWSQRSSSDCFQKPSW